MDEVAELRHNILSRRSLNLLKRTSFNKLRMLNPCGMAIVGVFVLIVQTCAHTLRYMNDRAVLRPVLIQIFG
jgi:hypothetical protein